MYWINEPHIHISGRGGDQRHKGSFERMGGLWLVFSAHNQGFFIQEATCWRAVQLNGLCKLQKDRSCRQSPYFSSLQERHLVSQIGYYYYYFFICTKLKVFIEFVAILLLFYVLYFWLQGMGDLSSPTRGRTHSPGIGRQNLNRWTTRGLLEWVVF